MSLDPRTQDESSRHEIKLLHYRQRYNWDCGISCVLMVLPQDKRRFLMSHMQTICKEEGFSRSTWTIDLCYLLKRLSVNFVYYTTTIGIHPQHKGHNFYERILHKDEERVTERFSKAAENEVEIEERSISAQELVSHIRDHGPVILLTNADFLHCDNCKKNKLTSELMNCLPWAASYHGHYIVVCGFDLTTNKFLYRNPAYSNRVCAIDFGCFNRARFCYGTDEDCICVYYKQ